MPSIADVYVTVLPETARLAEGIRRALREVDPSAREAGARWGREIEQGVGRPKVELQADTAKARAEIDAAARDRKATVEVDADTLGSSVERGISQGGQAGIGALQPALLGIGGTMLAGIASALSGLAGLAPAGLLGAGGLVGTLAIGLDGVKAAYDAVNKASQASGQDQIDKARETATAQRGLTDAVQSQAQAQRDVSTAYRDAKNNLDDLNLSLQGGKISEAQAYNNVLKARRDLARGGFKDQLDLNDAQLRVASAEQQWQESRQRNVELTQKDNEAKAKGVEGSDQVTAAKERERRANEAVTAAQQSLNQATSKTSDTAKTAMQAMALLSPNAQAFVNTLMSMKPAFQEFKNSIQDALFLNIGPQFQQLATTYMPLLQSFMGGMASTMNQAFGQIAGFLQQPATMQAMQQIFANIGSSFQVWSQAIQPFVAAFLKIAQVGSGFLPQLAQMVVQVAQAFNQWAQSGQLGEWIQTGMTALKQLGGVIGQLLPMFMQLAPIGTATLTAISSVLTTLAPYIPSLAASFVQLLNAITPLITQILNVLLPALTSTAALLGRHPQLIADVVVAFLAWKTISGVGSLLASLGGVSTMLRTTLPADAAAGAARMSSALGPVAALVAGIYAATQGHPEDYVWGGPKSPKSAADQGHWAKVLFGDTVGGWLERSVFNTSPSASAAPFSPNDVYGPMSRGALDALHGTDGNFPSSLTPTPPLATPPGRTPLMPGSMWTPPGGQPQQWVVGKGWVPAAPAGAPPALPTAAAPSGYAPSGYPGDAALLANVPAGRYTQDQRGDLTQGLADCSSAVEDLVNIMQGHPTAGANMSTGNEADWLTKHGFLPTSQPMPGTFQVGFNPEHTQATLPGGTNFNWGSDAAAAKGGRGGSGAWDPAFTSHYYLPGSNVAGMPGAPGMAGMPGMPTPGVSGPPGTQQDPMYVAMTPDMLKKQQQAGPGQQLGQDIFSGILQEFGFDGSVFKDPTSFGAFKFLKSGMGVLSNFMKGGQQGQPQGGDGASLPNFTSLIPGLNISQPNMPGMPSTNVRMPDGPFGPPTGPPPGPVINGDYRPINVSPNVNPSAILGPVQAEQNAYNATTHTYSGSFPP